MLGSELIWELQGCCLSQSSHWMFFILTDRHSAGPGGGFQVTLLTQRGQGPMFVTSDPQIKLWITTPQPENCISAGHEWNPSGGAWVEEQAHVRVFWPRDGHIDVGIVWVFLNSFKGFELVWASLLFFIFLRIFLLTLPNFFHLFSPFELLLSGEAVTIMSSFFLLGFDFWRLTLWCLVRFFSFFLFPLTLSRIDHPSLCPQGHKSTNTSTFRDASAHASKLFSSLCLQHCAQHHLFNGWKSSPSLLCAFFYLFLEELLGFITMLSFTTIHDLKKNPKRQRESYI